jgi:hypothetical protein
MAMDLRWKDRVEDEKQPARLSAKTVDRMIESVGHRSRFMLRKAAGLRHTDDLNEWRMCPRHGEAEREPIALDYIPEPANIAGEAHAYEEKGKTVFRHKIQVNNNIATRTNNGLFSISKTYHESSLL